MPQSHKFVELELNINNMIHVLLRGKTSKINCNGLTLLLREQRTNNFRRNRCGSRRSVIQVLAWSHLGRPCLMHFFFKKTSSTLNEQTLFEAINFCSFRPQQNADKTLITFQKLQELWLTIFRDKYQWLLVSFCQPHQCLSNTPRHDVQPL